VHGAGAALYISVAEHPARMAMGTDLAIVEWRLSYRRAIWMQAPLAVAGMAFALVAWARGDGVAWLVGAIFGRLDDTSWSGVTETAARAGAIAIVLLAVAPAGTQPRAVANLKDIPLAEQVMSVGHCLGKYDVTLRNGSTCTFKEYDLAFKIDSARTARARARRRSSRRAAPPRW
jgi:hypothetical protein